MRQHLDQTLSKNLKVCNHGIGKSHRAESFVSNDIVRGDSDCPPYGSLGCPGYKTRGARISDQDNEIERLKKEVSSYRFAIDAIKKGSHMEGGALCKVCEREDKGLFLAYCPACEIPHDESDVIERLEKKLEEINKESE